MSMTSDPSPLGPFPVSMRYFMLQGDFNLDEQLAVGDDPKRTAASIEDAMLAIASTAWGVTNITIGDPQQTFYIWDSHALAIVAIGHYVYEEANGHPMLVFHSTKDGTLLAKYAYQAIPRPYIAIKVQ